MTVTVDPQDDWRAKMRAVADLNDRYETMSPVQIVEDVLTRAFSARWRSFPPSVRNRRCCCT